MHQIYKVDKVKIDLKEKAQFYQIFFCSLNCIITKQRLSKAYADLEVENGINDIIRNYLKSIKSILL